MYATQDTQRSRPATRDKSLVEQELDEKFPNRPRNHSSTLPFHDLYLTLFNPLNDNKKKPTGPVVARKKQGPHGPSSHNPHEVRRSIIERFISRWRSEVGQDIYPAFRLIIPEKDRDRAMYGLKEKTIGRVLVKVMKINKDSEDGLSLLNWKVPGNTMASRMAGDFPGRCYEVIIKRPILTEPGKMTIQEVNDLLDQLASAQEEEDQVPIFEKFYSSMNADELMWLIRVILKQMKVGATERTFFDIWHPDAESLFNVSSSLRRVCWELYDPNFRLDGDDRGITLMQCFQPQLAQFQMNSFEKMVERMRPTENDPEFWIEEKLDGERMQMHMVSDNSVRGGKRFGFWSRKAKDYTYLYGNGFYDDNSALTRHLKEAFHNGVENIVLDGEMITWDPGLDAMVPFGTLKTAALAEQKNPFSNTGQRPLYRIFDILYLNGKALTSYTLRDRRKALEASLKSVHRRFEVHTYQPATNFKEIEPLLRKVVAEASEGLVLKNPRSAYKLSDRNDDWMKVKPEYLTEFGESLDCIVVGGYFGSGHRGGNLATFLCGLRVDENQVSHGENPQKVWSFFKVGGGMTAADYASIRHKTDGKWVDWDIRNPPTDWIELGGKDKAQFERPDVWIKPQDSVVLEVKAASVHTTTQFRTGFTLRFPRFKRLREDRTWATALSLQGFLTLQANAEKQQKEKELVIDNSRRKRLRVATKKALTIAGAEGNVANPYAGPSTGVFDGLSFYIMSECLKPEKKSKAELEQLVKANGGKIYQTHSAASDTICVADKRLVHVAGLQKGGEKNIIRPSWLLQCIKQAAADGPQRARFILPFEPSNVFHSIEDFADECAENVDEFGDSFARDITVDELREIFDAMTKSEHKSNARELRLELEAHGNDLGELKGWMFEDCKIFFDGVEQGNGTNEVGSGEVTLQRKLPSYTAQMAGASLAAQLSDKDITHVVVDTADRARVREIRKAVSERSRLPRIVTVDWVKESWKEGTRLDEERFAPT